MDTFDVKLEKKRNAILKHRRLSRVANLLRFVEFCVVLILISRLTVHLPVAFKSSGEYFRGLSVALVSPRFVFILGNVIVITLFFKAGQFSPQGSSSETDLYDEFVKKSEINRAIPRYEIGNRGKQSKKSVDEKKITSLDVHASKKTMKNYRRTKSENIKRTNSDKACKQLMKSRSEKCIKHNDPDDKLIKCCSSYPEDGLSNEQFRNTVEAFIARQKKLLREEEEEYSVICTDLE